MGDTPPTHTSHSYALYTLTGDYIRHLYMHTQ